MIICPVCGTSFKKKGLKRFCNIRCTTRYHLDKRRQETGGKEQYSKKMTGREKEQAILLLVLLGELSKFGKPDINLEELREAWRYYGRMRLSVVGGKHEIFNERYHG